MNQSVADLEGVQVVRLSPLWDQIISILWEMYEKKIR